MVPYLCPRTTHKIMSDVIFKTGEIPLVFSVFLHLSSLILAYPEDVLYLEALSVFLRHFRRESDPQSAINC